MIELDSSKRFYKAVIKIYFYHIMYLRNINCLSLHFIMYFIYRFFKINLRFINPNFYFTQEQCLGQKRICCTKSSQDRHYHRWGSV